jgi:DNA-binding CsgD family transcriptional regulator
MWVHGSRSPCVNWLTLHGSTMNDPTVPSTSAVDTADDDGRVSVVIEAAPASDIAQMLVLAYGLTRRERQILQRVISGLTSADIARDLYISPNTVQDHLKSIFSKVGVRSRGQLVAHILGEYYLARTERG